MKKKKTKAAATAAGKKYLLQLTRRGIFLGICLFFFISAWMFALGVLVGRGTAPVHFDIEVLQKELIALKESIIRQEQEKQRAETAPIEKRQELDFYEALKGPKKNEKLKFKPSEKKTAPSASPRTTSPAFTSLKKKTKAGGSPMQNGAYAVQVASTKNAGSADQLVAKLKKGGYRAYKTKAKVAGKGIWFRVRVGGYGSRAEADKANHKLSKTGYKGMVVKN